MDASHVDDDLVNILFTEAQIQERLAEMAEQIAADYEGKDLLLVGILRGAVMVMADLARALPRHVEMDWIAISSYGSGTKSSGVVRLLKDLDTDITGRHVLIVDEIVDTGLTLSWLVNSLGSRNAASVEIATLLRKPEALTMPVEPTYIGWDIPNEFVVGYGLDYRERYRNLRDIGDARAPRLQLSGRAQGRARHPVSQVTERAAAACRRRWDHGQHHHQHLGGHCREAQRLGPVADVVADLRQSPMVREARNAHDRGQADRAADQPHARVCRRTGSRPPARAHDAEGDEQPPDVGRLLEVRPGSTGCGWRPPPAAGTTQSTAQAISSGSCPLLGGIVLGHIVLDGRFSRHTPGGSFGSAAHRTCRVPCMSLWNMQW